MVAEQRRLLGKGDWVAEGRDIGTVVAPDADVGDFAFGYVEFDQNPKAPGGVPGFDSWPPGSPHPKR